VVQTREKEQLSSSAKSSILESLLPVVDNFELAKGSIKCETEGEEKINQSYQNMYKQMVETFRGLGLTAVPAVGEPFDPEVHEALMREPTADAEEGTIIKVRTSSSPCDTPREPPSSLRFAILLDPSPSRDCL
jgi:molecular chaperone GrpE